MADKNLATQVNNFMIAAAPTLVEASTMSYDILKALARALVYKVGTTKEHAEYVMNKKYGHIYAPGVVRAIISEGIADEVADRIEVARIYRAKKKALALTAQRPMLTV